MTDKINGTDAPSYAELEAQLKGSMMLVGVLVRRLGGMVKILPTELLEIYGYTLERDDDPADAFVTLTVTPTPQEDDDGSEDDGTD